MRPSVFKTVKLLIFGNIFLIPFSIVVKNIAIRFIIGSLSGISYIVILSFITKTECYIQKNELSNVKRHCRFHS